MTALTHQLVSALLEPSSRELDNSVNISVYESLAGIHLVEHLKD